ncbi:hypothetical protein WS48_09700 [Burkholderia sp. RF7-non_BP1]|nr:hypothetical protein WS48_09700 [Burkholderia sp. RF7-non_BP1]KUZ01108.1 hypothetical protein WS49_00885 [Burkholderia sp. RF7-non_BP4]
MRIVCNFAKKQEHKLMFLLWPMPEHLVNYERELKVGTSTRHDLGDQFHCRTLSPRPDIARIVPSPLQLRPSWMVRKLSWKQFPHFIEIKGLRNGLAHMTDHEALTFGIGHRCQRLER